MVRPVVAELARVIVNDPFATALTQIVPLPTFAALAVTGVNSGVHDWRPAALAR
jgi:hypothetical protein